MARNPLTDLLIRSARDAGDELPTFTGAGAGTGEAMSRRTFLGITASAALAALAAPPAPARPANRRHRARVAVVGAGFAGLAAAEALARAGLSVSLHEAGDRAGGRVRSLPDGVGPGLVAELGGEFIDTGHATARALAKRFRLPLLDVRTAAERRLKPVYRFDGADLDPEAAGRDLAAFLRRNAADLRAAATARGAAARPAAAVSVDLHALDALSLADYLSARDCPRPLRGLIEIAYTGEFGLDPADQGCIDFLDMMTDFEPAVPPVGRPAGEGVAPGSAAAGSAGASLLGASDERFKISGGNERLARRLAEALARTAPDALTFGHRLAAIRPAGGKSGAGRGLVLVFDRAGSMPVEVPCDFAIVTVPFNLLRSVDLAAMELPADKAACIAGLGYGNTAKVIMATPSRPWRAAGRGGDSFADTGHQATWDTVRGQAGATAGGLTVFLGGGAAAGCAAGTPAEAAARLRASVAGALPEASDALAASAASGGKVLRAHWPSEPLAGAGYAAFRPGQWTAMSGIEARPEAAGRLLFAGEHCSAGAQGYMEGALETGLAAARQVMAGV